MFKREILFFVATLVLVCAVQAREFSHPYTGYLSSSRVTYQISGKVTDTDKSLIIPPFGGAPRWFFVGVTLSIQTLEAEGEDPPAPIFTNYVEKGRKKMKVQLPKKIDFDVQAVLQAHRRPFGLGVSGPLKVKGRLCVSLDEYDDGAAAVRSYLIPTELDGPKGSWQAQH